MLKRDYVRYSIAENEYLEGWRSIDNAVCELIPRVKESGIVHDSEENREFAKLNSISTISKRCLVDCPATGLNGGSSHEMQREEVRVKSTSAFRWC